MDLLQRYDYYIKWEQEHKAEITSILAKEFTEKYKQEIFQILRNSDFYGMIGVPLFVLFVVLTVKYSLIIGLLVSFAIGWYIRYFAKHIILCSFKLLFERHEYKQILEQYVADYWRPQFEKTETEEQRAEINALYDSFKRELLFSCTRFEYWK